MSHHSNYARADCLNYYRNIAHQIQSISSLLTLLLLITQAKGSSHSSRRRRARRRKNKVIIPSFFRPVISSKRPLSILRPPPSSKFLVSTFQIRYFCCPLIRSTRCSAKDYLRSLQLAPQMVTVIGVDRNSGRLASIIIDLPMSLKRSAFRDYLALQHVMFALKRGLKGFVGQRMPRSYK
jgi:hypothetical protein